MTTGIMDPGVRRDDDRVARDGAVQCLSAPISPNKNPAPFRFRISSLPPVTRLQLKFDIDRRRMFGSERTPPLLGNPTD
jgi:hypothetical protein